MRLSIFLLAALPAAAHMVSVSTGEAKLAGARLHYELRMPLFEAQHIAKPEALLDAIQFVGARRTAGSCSEIRQDASYRCTASYEYPEPPGQLTVECRLHTVTVPNHVHVLRGWHNDKMDQAVFEMSAPKATLRFEPPSRGAIAAAVAWSGFTRAIGSPAPVLFLLALALAARTRRELFTLLGMFFAGQVAAAVLLPRLAWYPSSRFLEAAAALTIAYLAVEILLLPSAGQRWLVVAILGLFHGLAFATYLRSTGQSAPWFLGGAFPAELLLAVVFGFALRFAARVRLPPWLIRAPAGILLVTGLGWFAWLLV